MQIPVLSGIYTDGNSDFRTSYPRNLVPVPKKNGISEGYLRPADGIVRFGMGPGADRGGINWNGECYRVMGNRLVKISSEGNVTELGSIAGVGLVTLDYGFDRLSISGGGNLYYWDGTTLTQVTDPDLGTVIDHLWVDGYYMSTDGQYLIVTELNAPTSVNPLKYGSAEADPDPIVALIKMRNEVYALNRHTIEVFQNVGGDFFPFERVEGAQMQRGCVGTHACAYFMEAIAFVGGGRNEQTGVWLGLNGQTTKISSREIDQILAEYPESVLSEVLLESRVHESHQHLYLHLPDQTLVYDAAASQEMQQPVWFILTTSLVGKGQYRARSFVWCYGKWLVGDPTSRMHGYITDAVSSHYGNENGWEFGTTILYNEGRGAVVHELELVCLTGRVEMLTNPTVWTSYTIDGQNYSQEKPRTAGMIGQTVKRISWLQQGFMRHWRCQRFRGTSASHISIARLEARVEPLNV